MLRNGKGRTGLADSFNHENKGKIPSCFLLVLLAKPLSIHFKPPPTGIGLFGKYQTAGRIPSRRKTSLAPHIAGPEPILQSLRLAGIQTVRWTSSRNTLGFCVMVNPAFIAVLRVEISGEPKTAQIVRRGGSTLYQFYLERLYTAWRIAICKRAFRFQRVMGESDNTRQSP